MENPTSYSDKIPNFAEFKKLQEGWRSEMANSQSLRKQAIELIVSSEKFKYGYQWEWCGVPIIRHPDDIVLQQEIMWDLKPNAVVETGIARGGSLVLSSSLMELTGRESRVLGLDKQILDHAKNALRPWTNDGRVKIFECDSTSQSAFEVVRDFLSRESGPTLLVLDSNHSHNHVFNELLLFGPLLSLGSIIMVADTIISEMPDQHYKNRPWSKQENPLTAVNAFLQQNEHFVIDDRWSRRSLMGECRDGILLRNS